MPQNEIIPCSGQDLFEAIERACKGLTYVSETDAPLEPFFRRVGPAGGINDLSHQLRIEHRNDAVSSSDPQEFFSRLTREADWQTEGQRADARRSGLLEQLLRTCLKDLTCVRLGKIRIDIYVIGSDDAGDVLGVKTRAVET